MGKARYELIKQLHEIVCKFAEEHRMTESEMLSYYSITLIRGMLKLNHTNEDAKGSFEKMYKIFTEGKKEMND